MTTELAEIRNKEIGLYPNIQPAAAANALRNVELPLILFGQWIRPDRKAEALDTLSNVGLADRVHHKRTKCPGNGAGGGGAGAGEPTLHRAGDEPTETWIPRPARKSWLYSRLSHKETRYWCDNTRKKCAHARRIIRYGTV